MSGKQLFEAWRDSDKEPQPWKLKSEWEELLAGDRLWWEALAISINSQVKDRYGVA